MRIPNAPSSAGTSPAKPSPVSGKKEDAKLRAACEDMEAVFLNLMLTQMRKTVPKDSLVDGGNGEEIMRSMLDSELTKGMSKAGGTGLADMLYRQLSPKVNNGTNSGQAPK